MKTTMIRKGALMAAILAVAVTAGCSTNQVADNTGSVLGFAGRTTVHAVSGAGKLAYKGTKSAIGAVTGND